MNKINQNITKISEKKDIISLTILHWLEKRDLGSFNEILRDVRWAIKDFKGSSLYDENRIALTTKEIDITIGQK